MLEKLKEPLSGIVKIIAKPFSFINPNILTLTGFVLGFLPMYFFAEGKTLWAGLSMIIYLFDMLDGVVARSTGRTSIFGAIFDSSLDRIIDGFLIVAIVYGGYVDLVLGSLVLIGSYMVSYVRARTEGATNNSFKMNVGLAQRGDRIALIMLGALLYSDKLYRNVNSMELVFGILAVTTWLTVLWRFIYGYKHLSKNNG